MTESEAALATDGLILWQARPYVLRHDGAWHPGKVHQIDPAKRTTLCGKTRAEIPGFRVSGAPDAITCKGGLASREAAVRRRERDAQWATEQVVREQRRLEWRVAYQAYRLTGAWASKRQLKLQRAGFTCEHCGVRPASEVHHLRYPDAWPGTADWIAREKLTDLVATCRECHDDVHTTRSRSIAP
jgi:5-methylcytosine-specific restriction endonuclease McrA